MEGRMAHPFGDDKVDVSAAGTEDDPGGGCGCCGHRNVLYYEPRKGLEFETKEAAHSFYREYARSVGFGVTVKASRRSKKSGKFIDVKIACSRFRSKRQSQSSETLNARSCPKTDCKAGMHMKRRADGKWFIYSVVRDHNHEIFPDDVYRAISGQYKHHTSVVFQKRGLQSVLGNEDFELLLDHLSLMQSETPNFYYAVDVSKEKLIRNIFWVEANGRNDYIHFSDVVFLDTSYLRKGCRIPFVPVVGLNHHSQYILLGCALIGEETSSSFVWLMRTWLRAMGSQSPNVVVTPHEKPLKEVMADVFPDARHCFCLWSVLGEIRTNLRCRVNNSQELEGILENCISQLWTDEDFENKWQEMVDKFDLSNDEWIRSLYEDRKQWVPAYTGHSFLGGFSTNEQSESISSVFNKYIHTETTFREFLLQYKSFLLYSNKEEDKAEFETWHQEPILKSPSSFEKQMSVLYTHAVFKKFQAEVLGIVACCLQREVKDRRTVTFWVNDLEGHQHFVVSWKEGESEISCLCRSFEYRGFLCRHAMMVLQLCGVSSIPSHYILKRWTKDAKIRDVTSLLSSSHNTMVQRLNNLCKFGSILGEEGSASQETWDIALFSLEEALKQCVGVNNSLSVLETNVYDIQGFLNMGNGNLGNNMAEKSKRKKLLKKRKVQHEVEAASMGIQSSSQNMLAWEK